MQLAVSKANAHRIQSNNEERQVVIRHLLLVGHLDGFFGLVGGLGAGGALALGSRQDGSGKALDEDGRGAVAGGRELHSRRSKRWMRHGLERGNFWRGERLGGRRLGSGPAVHTEARRPREGRGDGSSNQGRRQCWLEGGGNRAPLAGEWHRGARQRTAWGCQGRGRHLNTLPCISACPSGLATDVTWPPREQLAALGHAFSPQPVLAKAGKVTSHCDPRASTGGRAHQSPGGVHFSGIFRRRSAKRFHSQTLTSLANRSHLHRLAVAFASLLLRH